MQANVFWLTKDWRESWDATDFQQLLVQVHAAIDRPAVHEVPTRAFCDTDMIAVGQPGMRCDEDTAILLHDHSAVSVPGTNIDFESEVHWDGQQFWLRPTCPDELVALLSRAPDTETKKRLLLTRNTWLAEADHTKLVEQAGKDEEAWCELHGAGLAVLVHYRDDGTVEVQNALAPDERRTQSGE